MKFLHLIYLILRKHQIKNKFHYKELSGKEVFAGIFIISADWTINVYEKVLESCLNTNQAPQMFALGSYTLGGTTPQRMKALFV